MAYGLVVTPTGHLGLRETADEAAALVAGDEGGIKKLVRAFEASSAEGLFVLACQPAPVAASSAQSYWRELGTRYLTELCHTPETAGTHVDPIEPPPAEELAATVSSLPPMPGAEYVTVSGLQATWRDLDGWVRSQVAGHRDALAGFLQDRAPLWRQVGRVCFHLAENKRNPLYPFAFLATYSSGLSVGSRVRYQPLGKALEEYAGSQNKRALVRLLSPVQRASEQSPLVKQLLDSGDLFHPLAWTPAEAYRFLKEVPQYEASGVLVRLPDWWHKRPRPQVGVSIGQNRQPSLDAKTMLDFSVTLVLGDQTLTEEEWEQLMAADDGLVLLKGRWVEVDREKLTAALDHWRKVEWASQDGSISFVEGMRLLAGAPSDLAAGNDEPETGREWSFVKAGDWMSELLEKLRNPDGGSRTAVDRELRATLRPYQQVGVDWLWLTTKLGLGACLADDMGLGKTIQVLGLLLRYKQDQSSPRRRPALLVLPASLLANWKSELARFAPSLRAVFVHPSETDKQAIVQFSEAPETALRDIDVVLTTYGMLLRHAWLLDQAWQLVVLDEAQAIKNPSSQQSRSVKRLRAQARVALTGTPVENRLSDLWSLFDFLCPGLLGSAAKFKQFVKSLEDRRRGDYGPLRNLVQPYILRRMKTDQAIITDLPEKTEVRAFCTLSKQQAALYKKSVAEMAAALEGADGMKRRGLVLAYLMRFKQICNHPSQWLGDGAFQPSESGKFSRLAEICEEIASRQEKALVFTQFREMTEPLCEFLSEVFQRPGVVLHGGTSVKARKTLIDRFQAEDGPPFFVLSLKAGGTGLNLTAASHVIHFDRWWNPAVENQATDRAFRIGQHRNVLVHKFVCRGTIEERIDELIEGKKTLANDLLEGGAERLLTEMSDAQLIDLVSLDINKALE